MFVLYEDTVAAGIALNIMLGMLCGNQIYVVRSEQNRMIYKLFFILPVLCLFAGCNSSRYVLCVASTGEFEPQSESELLAELNSQLPFTISQNHFISKKKSSGLVGWAVVRNHRERDIAKAELKKSATLKLLQIEALTPEFEAIMKQRKE